MAGFGCLLTLCPVLPQPQQQQQQQQQSFVQYNQSGIGLHSCRPSGLHHAWVAVHVTRVPGMSGPAHHASMTAEKHTSSFPAA